MELSNTQACFVRLWLRLERTRLLCRDLCKRFCIHNILEAWFGDAATDDFIWEVCHRAVVDGQQLYGWDELPPPKRYPRKHRELLRAIVATHLRIGPRHVSLRDLDAAYSIAFPDATPINVNKKRKHPALQCCSVADKNGTA